MTLALSCVCASSSRASWLVSLFGVLSRIQRCVPFCTMQRSSTGPWVLLADLTSARAWSVTCPWRAVIVIWIFRWLPSVDHQERGVPISFVSVTSLRLLRRTISRRRWHTASWLDVSLKGGFKRGGAQLSLIAKAVREAFAGCGAALLGEPLGFLGRPLPRSRP